MQDNLNQYDAQCRRHGHWEVYFDNGQLWYRGEYIHGKIHGLWIVCREDGSLCSKQTIDMGKRIGYFIYYGFYKCTKQFYAN